MRLIFWVLLSVAFGAAANAAEPTCSAYQQKVAPNSPQCFETATDLQDTDIVYGVQGTGPSRSNQSVKIPISQLKDVAAGAAPVQSVAGREGDVTLSTTDISGLGTIATQGAGSVAITGGAISGADVSASTVTSTGGTATGTLAQREADRGLGPQDFAGFYGDAWQFTHTVTVSGTALTMTQSGWQSTDIGKIIIIPFAGQSASVGYLTSVPVTSGGTGYTGCPTFTVSGSGGDSTKTLLSCTLSGGALQSVVIIYGGDKWPVSGTTVSLSGGGGTGATLGTPTVKAYIEPLVTTISAVNSGTSITLGSPALTPLTSVSVPITYGHDDAPAINAAIADAASKLGGRVVFPTGKRFLFASTITLPNSAGVTLEGAGVAQTVLYAGAAMTNGVYKDNTPLFSISGLGSNGTIKHLTIDCNRLVTNCLNLQTARSQKLQDVNVFNAAPNYVAASANILLGNSTNNSYNNTYSDIVVQNSAAMYAGNGDLPTYGIKAVNHTDSVFYNPYIIGTGASAIYTDTASDNVSFFSPHIYNPTQSSTNYSYIPIYGMQLNTMAHVFNPQFDACCRVSGIEIIGSNVSVFGGRYNDPLSAVSSVTKGIHVNSGVNYATVVGFNSHGLPAANGVVFDTPLGTASASAANNGGWNFGNFGVGNTVTGLYAACSGSFNTCSGNYSFAIGASNTTSTTGAVAMGQNASDVNLAASGCRTFAQTRWGSTNGVPEVADCEMFVATTDGTTPTRITVGGGAVTNSNSFRLNVPNTTATCEAKVDVVDTANVANHGSFHLTSLVSGRNSGGTFAVDSAGTWATDYLAPGLSGLGAPVVSADTTNKQFAFTVTGLSGKTLHWAMHQTCQING